VYDIAIRLTQEPTTALTLNNTKFQTMWTVGPSDMYGGMTRFVQIYEE
jgi:hypothetical protein